MSDPAVESAHTRSMRHANDTVDAIPSAARQGHVAAVALPDCDQTDQLAGDYLLNLVKVNSRLARWYVRFPPICDYWRMELLVRFSTGETWDARLLLRGRDDVMWQLHGRGPLVFPLLDKAEALLVRRAESDLL